MKYQNQRPDLADQIKTLVQSANSVKTVPHGVKTVNPGEGLQLLSGDGQEIFWDWETAAEYDTRISEGRAAIAAAEKELAQTRLDLDAAGDRIGQAETQLTEADKRITAEETARAQAVTRLEGVDASLKAAQTTLEGKAAQAASDLAGLDSRLTTARSDLTTAQGEISTLKTSTAATAQKVTAAEGRLTTAEGQLNAAQSDLAGVKATADAAKTAAAAADQKALDAAGLAGSKGRVIYQSTAPTGTGADAKNLWIRTTDNKPHTWNGTTWVAVTDKAATDAATAAAAAKTAADKAQADATKALADAAAAQRTADAAAQAVAEARQKVDATAVDLGKVDTRLTTTAGDLATLQGTVGNVQTAVAESDRKAVAAQATADQASTAAGNAASKAATAQTTADQAKTAAGTADEAARAASGLAATKGEVIYQASAPTGARAVAQNLWIRTTDNKPHTWNGTSWVAVTDKAATDAATAAASAQSAAGVAQSTADQAKSDAAAAAQSAVAAMTKAGQAQASADGKTTITATVNTPSGVGLAVGDLHMQLSSLGSGGQIIRQWRWNGSAWVDQKISGDFISNLDVGKLTGVFANISQHLQAGSIGADKVIIGQGENLIPDSAFLSDMTNTARTAGTGWSVQARAGDKVRVLTTNSTTQADVTLTSTPTDWIQVDPSGKYQLSMGVGGPNQVGVYLTMRLSDGSITTVGSEQRLQVQGSLGTYRVEWDLATMGSPVAVRPTVRRYATPSGATNYYTQVSAVTMRRKVGTVLIEDGAITGDKVEAQTVAAKVGQFVKVQAANVEVTEDLSTRVVNAMTANAKRLVVTEDAILNRATVIEGIITPKITVVSQAAADAKAAAQSAQGTADQAKGKVDAVTTTESGVTVIDGGKILTDSVTSRSVKVTGELSARVANFMDVASRNLIVTGDATLAGSTWAKRLAAEVVTAAEINVQQLRTTGTAAINQAVIDKLWADTFASHKVTTDELVVGSGSNLIPNGWAEKGTTGTGWDAFGVTTATETVTGQPAPTVFWARGTRVANVSFPVKAGAEHHFSVWARSNVAGSRFYVQLWHDTGASVYLVSNQTVPDGAWAEYTTTYIPPTGVSRVNSISVYAMHTNGTQSADGTQWFGAFTLTEKTGAVLIQDGAITTPKLKVTEDMSAQIVSAMSLTAKTGIFTDGLQATDAALLGTTVAKALVVEKLTGRDAILSGTVDVAQLNVTGAMSAEIVRAMDVQARRGIFTEGLTAQDATLLGTTVAETLNAGTVAARIMTSGMLQTTTAANRGVKINSTGINAWNGAGTQTMRLNGTSNYLTGEFATAQSGQRVKISNAGNTAAIDLYASRSTSDHVGIWYDSPDTNVLNSVGRVLAISGSSYTRDSPGLEMWPMRGTFGFRGRWQQETDATKFVEVFNNNGLNAGAWVQLEIPFQSAFPTNNSLLFPVVSAERASGADVVVMVHSITASSITLVAVNKSTSGNSGAIKLRAVVFNLNS